MCIFSLLLLLKVSILLASENVSPNGALKWDGPQQPQRSSFDFSGEKVTVITGDAVLLTKARLHQKNQIFIRDFIVDITSPARSGWNLGQQAKRYEGARFSHHEGFISHLEFGFEYKLHGPLSQDRCVTMCLLENASLPSTGQHILELSTLFTSLKDFFWIKVDQHMSGNKYSLDFNHKQVFPDNLWSNGSVALFHYFNDRYQVIPNDKLHGITSYYDFESGNYYSRQFHQLSARMDVAQNLQILIPLARTAHVDRFAQSNCLCTRDLSLNLQNTYKAQTFARRARYRIVRSPRLLEVQRVKRVSNDPLPSNVLSILHNPKFYFSPSFSCISPWDLHHLRIVDHKNASLRYKRALPLAAKLSLIMATKLAQFSLPYAFSNKDVLLQKLKTEVKGKFLTMPQVANVSLQSYLTEKFGSGSTNLHLLEDRINVSYDEPMSLTSQAPPSLQHAQDLERVSHDLRHIEKDILPQISQGLLQQLLKELPYTINKGSPILLKTTTAGTFQRHRFWIELFRHDLSFTNFQGRSLPFKAVNGHYTAYQVPNDTVLDIEKDGNTPLMEKSCLTHLLTDTDVTTNDCCAMIEYKPTTKEHMFALMDGNIYSLHGPAILHLECFQHVATAVNLEYEFNVVFISHSCSASLDKEHKTSIVLATMAIFSAHPYQVLVQINVPKLASQYEKIYFWLILLSSATGGCALCFLIGYVMFYYIKLRYRPRFSVNADGIIDISVNNVHPSLPTSGLSSQLTVNQEVELSDHPSAKKKHEEEVFFETADIVSLPLETLHSSVRKQKPASH